MHDFITLPCGEVSECCTPNGTCPDTARIHRNCDSVDDWTCGPNPHLLLHLLRQLLIPGGGGTPPR